MKEKQCTRCGKTKPLSGFHKDKNRKDGHQGWCRECISECARRRRAGLPYIPTGREHGSRFIDETGHRYGKLVVIEQAGSDKHGAKWLCRCDCGKETTILGYSLRHGSTKSCGCLQGSPLPKGVAAFNHLYSGRERMAKKEGHKWELTKEQVHFLSKQLCHYCGAEPAQIHSGRGRTNGPYIYNGIDRVDNSCGYTMDNVVPCCKVCNFAKKAKTVKEFTDWVTRVYKHFVVNEQGVFFT